MLRGAAKTLVGFDDMHCELASLAVEGTTLEQGYRSDFRLPAWQADDFATNVHNARCCK